MIEFCEITECLPTDRLHIGYLAIINAVEAYGDNISLEIMPEILCYLLVRQKRRHGSAGVSDWIVQRLIAASETDPELEAWLALQ